MPRSGLYSAWRARIVELSSEEWFAGRLMNSIKIRNRFSSAIVLYIKQIEV